MSTYKDSNGYLRYVDSNILVHRRVAEKMLGRKLNSEEVVHHKDRNKTNNHPNNLYVCRNQEHHNRLHEIDKWNYGAKASYQGFSNHKKKKSLWSRLFG